jgi:hypothetical protein
MSMKAKAVPLHAMKALVGGIGPTHSRPRHLMGVSGQRHAVIIHQLLITYSAFVGYGEKMETQWDSISPIHRLKETLYSF